MAIKLLQGSKKPQLYDYQGMMPILPLPALKDTMRRVQFRSCFFPQKNLFNFNPKTTRRQEKYPFFPFFFFLKKILIFVFLEKIFLEFFLEKFCFVFLAHGLDHYKRWKCFSFDFFMSVCVLFFSTCGLCVLFLTIRTTTAWRRWPPSSKRVLAESSSVISTSNTWFRPITWVSATFSCSPWQLMEYKRLFSSEGFRLVGGIRLSAVPFAHHGQQ